MIRAPYVLLLLVPLAVLAVALWRRRVQRPRMIFSSIRLVQGTRPTLRMRLLRLPLVLTLACCALLVAALARPQAVSREHKGLTEGIDIMLVLDASESMRALDFSPNRLEKAKEVVKSFVAGRKEDRIGLVIFARDTFTLAPLTQDYLALQGFIDRIQFGLVQGDRTAIGMGLANAVNQLRKSKAKSKVVILLTDGENNAGRIDPLSAAGIAQSLGVRVYTIGVGSAHGIVNIPVQLAPNLQPVIQRIQSSLDVKQLTKIAKMNGGQFFHATDGQSLEEIYRQIDKMEKTRVDVYETRHFDDLGHYLMLPALALLLLALTLEATWLRTFP